MCEWLFAVAWPSGGTLVHIRWTQCGKVVLPGVLDYPIRRKSLPGHLGNHERDSCHCIVRRLATQGEALFETYRILPYDHFRCDLCPDGGLCNGLSKQYIVINPGRWRASQNMTDIYTCPNQDACLGGEGSECSTGYEGNLCSVCSSGYAQPTLGGQILRICSKCTPEYIGTIVLIAQFVAQSLIVLTIFRVASRGV